MKTCTTRIEHFHEKKRLVGVVFAGQYELSVEMVEPIPGVTGRTCIQPRWIAPPYVFAEGGRLTTEGSEAAGRLLVSALAARLRRDVVRARLREHLAHREKEVLDLIEATRRQVREDLRLQAPVDDETFYALRRALRRDLRSGLDPRVYQRRLRQLEERRGTGHRAHRVLLKRVIDHLQPHVPHVADFPDVIADAGIGVPRCRETLYLDE